MKRVFWVALGATAGVLLARRLSDAASRATHSLTPEGAADRVAGAFGGLRETVRELAEDVRAGMAERDIELRESLGLADNGVSDIDAARLHALVNADQQEGPH